jgi:hypothetical protein
MVAVVNYLRLPQPSRPNARQNLAELQRRTRQRVRKLATRQDNLSPRHRARVQRRAEKASPAAPRSLSHARQRAFREKLAQAFVDQGHANDVTSRYIREHRRYTVETSHRRPLSPTKAVALMNRISVGSSVLYFPRGEGRQRSGKVINITIAKVHNGITSGWVYIKAPRTAKPQKQRNPVIAVPLEFVKEIV